MKGRTTLILAILFVGLLAYVLKFQRGESRKERQIFSFSKERVAKLELTYADDEDTVVLEKQGESWQIRKPLKAKGSTDDIDRLLSDFAALESSTTFTEDEADDLTDDVAGLDKPEFIAQAWDARGKLIAKLAIGKKLSVGSDVYAMVNDEDYVTLGSWKADSLKKKSGDLRDKSVVEIAEDDDVEAVELKYPAHSIRLQRVDDEHWKITKPIQAEGDDWNCDDVLTKIKDLKAEEFVEKDKSKSPADYGLAKPQLTATVTLSKGGKQVVKLGKTAPDEIDRIYAAAEGRDEIFQVKDSILDDLRKEVTDLREKHLLDLMADDVRKIEIVNDGRTFVARRTDEDEWELEKPEKAKCDSTKITDILWDATGLRVDEFVAEKPKSLAPYGLDKPRATVTLTADRESYVILLGKEKDDRLYAKRGDRSNVVLVNDSLLKSLPRKVADIVEEEESEEDEEGDEEE